jgi:hypothetical protein
MIFKPEIHSRIYFYSLLLLAAALPLSIWMTSAAQIILVLNCLLDKQLKLRWVRLKERKSLLVFLLLYIVHLAGFLYTNDVPHGLYDLRIKLPILILPLVIGTSDVISEKKLNYILFIFIGAVLVGSFASILVFFGLLPFEINDLRDISIFVSHIRFSLMVVFAFFIVLDFGMKKDLSVIQRLGLFIIAFWLLFFIFISKTLTGIVIFMAIIPFVAWRYSARIDDIAPRFIVRVLIITMPLILFSFLSHSVGRFYYKEILNYSVLDKSTINGNAYFHDTLSTQTENGNYVWIYVNEHEIRENWNKNSSLAFDGRDRRGQELKYTLIRYMSSLGLRKDSVGVSSLSTEDIGSIEKGLTNYIFNDRYGFYPRIYELLWEIENYRSGNSPQGHSLAQRIVYAKAAVNIIQKFPVFGTGTGDVQKEFNSYYDEYYPEFTKRWRGRSHNQYLNFLVAFGIVGFALVMMALFLPPFMEKRMASYILRIFFVIVIMAMLNEDMLETHTGVSFAMFFYAVLVFGREREVN